MNDNLDGEFGAAAHRRDEGISTTSDAADPALDGDAARRGCEVLADKRFQRLAAISASQIYNLRKSGTYRKIRRRVQHTHTRQVAVAEQHQPDPKEQAGYLRMDTVHQGQHDGWPGVYHTNAVDTATQWQVVVCTKTISEQHLMPVLDAMRQQIPFPILGFHCDNRLERLKYDVVRSLADYER